MSIINDIGQKGSCILACIDRVKESSGKRDTTAADAKREFDALCIMANLGEAMQWVPVTDGLPEENKYVDILIDGKIRRTNCLHRNGTFYLNVYMEQAKNVTHYMDIPLPPGTNTQEVKINE